MTHGALEFAVTFALLVVASFSIVRLIPGDPARRIAGAQASAGAVEDIRQRLGLDVPLLNQFANYVHDLVRLDFGTSFALDVPVAQLLANRIPETMALAGLALSVVVVTAIPLGLVLAARTQGGSRPRLEVAATAGTGFLAAIPEFVTGTLLVAVFGVWLRWLPVAGADGFQSMILPAIALAIPPTAVLTRIVRVEALAILQLDYVRTARLKGASSLRLYIIHVLPNLMPTVLTVGGMAFVGLAGGTILVEYVFGYPGLGSALINAIVARDYPVIQAAILAFGVGVLLLNSLLGLIARLIDPRIGEA